MQYQLPNHICIKMPTLPYLDRALSSMQTEDTTGEKGEGRRRAPKRVLEKEGMMRVGGVERDASPAKPEGKH